MSRRPYFLDNRPVPPGVEVVYQNGTGKPLAHMDGKWHEVKWLEPENAPRHNGGSAAEGATAAAKPQLDAGDQNLERISRRAWEAASDPRVPETMRAHRFSDQAM
jgi:hypothetical protein